MKKLVFVIIIFISSCDDEDFTEQRNKLIGSWAIQSIEGDNVSNDNLVDFTIDFFSNGQYIRTEGNLKFTGNWDISSKNTLEVNWDGGGRGVFRIEKLTENELIYSSSPDQGTGLSQLSITYSFIKLNSSG